MKRPILHFYALSICVTATMIAGCGGSQPPIGAPGAIPQTSALATHGARGKSWMLRNANAGDLLYVADYGAGVIVYSYGPSGIRYVGYLSSPQNAEGECVDKTQNIFITDSNDEILEYAHGGTSPIAVLNDPYATPLSCSVDRITGNLAVAGAPFLRGSSGVAIYKHARGKPTFYADAGFGGECGYDDKGNLFIDGAVYSGRLNFAELAKGKSTFTNIALNQSFHAAGGIQWDGKHLAVGDLYEAVVYQFDISGSSGTEVGSTLLDGAGTVGQFFVDGDRVIAPSTFEDGSGFVSIYDYPAGGAAKKTRDVDSPQGVVVSRSRS
jgi:hypothetical protein